MNVTKRIKARLIALAALAVVSFAMTPTAEAGHRYVGKFKVHHAKSPRISRTFTRTPGRRAAITATKFSRTYNQNLYGQYGVTGPHAGYYGYKG